MAKKHTHTPGKWETWPQFVLDAAKETRPQEYKGVTEVQVKLCTDPECAEMVNERREY